VALMAAPKTLPQTRTFSEDFTLASIDQSREDLVRILAMCPLLRGRLVSVTFPAATRKIVRHGLGVAAACFVVRMNYDPAQNSPTFTEDDDQATDCDKTQQIAIIASAVCSVDLWFYPRASKDIDARQGQSL
jgi:hypothetical protein